MGKIAIIGTGPLQEEGVKFFSGQCLRTWHFTRPLMEAGHEIHLITHPINDQSYVAGRDPVCRPAEFKHLKYSALQTNTVAPAVEEIERQLNEFRPTAVFGINPFAASLSCRQRYRAPIWADMNGYVLAEGQTHCRLHDSDVNLEHFWEIEKQVISRADRISTVSRRQRYATLGELAMFGRLNRHTHNHPLVTFIPNAVSERFVNFVPPPPLLRGKVIPANSFLLLWSGGFNTWTDITTLYSTLERVMSTHPEFHFVATGGTIAGHDEKTFVQFKEMASQSPHAAQYHLLGWVETEVVDALFGESHLGINLDSENYETMFGARNRLTNMMACGLPILTTLGTEISRDIEAARVGLVTAIGDVAALVDCIEWAIMYKSALRDLGNKGREWSLNEFSYERTTKKAVEWAANPDYAPDNAVRLQHDQPELPLPNMALHSLDDLLSSCDRKIYEALRCDARDLAAIRKKPFWRWARAMKRLFVRKTD